MSPDVLDSQGKFQKFVYHNFFHIDGILRNLLLCRLVNESRVNMIRIHYNFLSKFVHASMSNLELYQTVRDYSSFQQLRADNIKELVLLYVTKLVSIYMKEFVTAYKTESNGHKCIKHERIAQELNALSSQLWLFEENPSPVDTELSNMTKKRLRIRNMTIPEGIIPWNDPLERLTYLKNTVAAF